MKNHSFTKVGYNYLLKCNETAYAYLQILKRFADAQGLPFNTQHEQRKVLALYEWYAAIKN